MPHPRAQGEEDVEQDEANRWVSSVLNFGEGEGGVTAEEESPGGGSAEGVAPQGLLGWGFPEQQQVPFATDDGEPLTGGEGGAVAEEAMEDFRLHKGAARGQLGDGKGRAHEPPGLQGLNGTVEQFEENGMDDDGGQGEEGGSSIESARQWSLGGARKRPRSASTSPSRSRTPPNPASETCSSEARASPTSGTASFLPTPEASESPAPATPAPATLAPPTSETALSIPAPQTPARSKLWRNRHELVIEGEGDSVVFHHLRRHMGHATQQGMALLLPLVLAVRRGDILWQRADGGEGFTLRVRTPPTPIWAGIFGIAGGEAALRVMATLVRIFGNVWDEEGQAFQPVDFPWNQDAFFIQAGFLGLDFEERQARRAAGNNAPVKKDYKQFADAFNRMGLTSLTRGQLQLQSFFQGTQSASLRVPQSAMAGLEALFQPAPDTPPNADGGA